MEKIIKHEERQVWFVIEFPEAGLKLIEAGEPVRPALLEALYEKNPALLEKILELDFEVYSEYSSWDDAFISETSQVYLTLKRLYGKEAIERKILANPVLWPNFLRFVSLKYAEKMAQIKKCLDDERWDDAYNFVKYSNLCLPLSDTSVRDKFWAASKNYKVHDIEHICGEKYLRNHGCSFLSIDEEMDVI